ncbi:MAG: phage tail protein [Gaiellales bacterium]
MGTDDFMAAVSAFAGPFAPVNYAICNGSIMSANQNNALFYLLGSAYGGDGQRTFALPNLQGGTVIGAGQQTPSTQAYRRGVDAPVTQSDFTNGDPAAAGGAMTPTTLNIAAVNAVPMNWVVCLQGIFPPNPSW